MGEGRVTKVVRRSDLPRLQSDEELDKFMAKVNQLSAEGMTRKAIAERFNISVFTLNGRIRTHKQKKSNST